MILKTKSQCDPITVELVPAQELRFRSDDPCDLLPDAAFYAVCRFLARTPSLLNPIAAESCRLRFERGKARRPVRRHCTAPALLLELPGAWATVDFLVGAETVAVTSVTLSAEYPMGKPAGDGFPR
jgi:hypothetical protein